MKLKENTKDEITGDSVLKYVDSERVRALTVFYHDSKINAFSISEKTPSLNLVVYSWTSEVGFEYKEWVFDDIDKAVYRKPFVAANLHLYKNMINAAEPKIPELLSQQIIRLLGEYEDKISDPIEHGD